ncbi:MAG: hypothetical protein IJU23_06870 [Proteobacteria bacterium]|nr:hypothetical protein [Pseudomonadota bacterium]
MKKRLKKKLGIWFDYKECWDLDYYAARWLLPRLKHLRNHLHSYPEHGGITSCEEWAAILDEIIYAMTYEANKWDLRFKITPEESERVTRGCRLLGEWFRDLWD